MLSNKFKTIFNKCGPKNKTMEKTKANKQKWIQKIHSPLQIPRCPG